jgi:hypothetical protein
LEPEYQVNLESDPTELIILSERYDTAPKFFFGFKLGAGYTVLDLAPNPNYSIPSEDPNAPPEAILGQYEPPIVISGGLFFQYPINDEFSVNLETHYNFRRTVLNREIINAEINSTSIQQITETQQWVEVPLLVNYKLPMAQNFLLEATGGPSFHYLLSSNLGITGIGEEINNLDMMEYRNQLNVSGILGLRGNFKIIGRNYVTVEALFQYRFIKEVNENVDTTELDWILKDAAYAEGQYKGHALILRAGFRFPRFNPELIK